MNTTQPSTPDPIQAAAMKLVSEFIGCYNDKDIAIAERHMRELVARERADNTKLQGICAARHDRIEELVRGLGLAKEALKKDPNAFTQAVNLLKAEAVVHGGKGVSVVCAYGIMQQRAEKAEAENARIRERVAELEELVSDLNGSYDGGRLDMIADWHDARLKREGRDADLKSGRSDGAVIRATIGHIRELESQLAAARRELAAMTPERDQWHTHYRDERSRGLQLQDALGDEMKRRAELETDVANLKKDRDDILRQWREREPQLRAAETDLSELQVAYGVLKRHADALAQKLNDILNEAASHPEFNPISGIARLPRGYTKIIRLCDSAIAAYRASQQPNP